MTKKKKNLFVVCTAEVLDSFCYIMAIKLSDLSAFDKKHVVLIGVKSATSIISFKLNLVFHKKRTRF